MLKQKGFTLVELMIVVAIVGVLAAIAVPNYRTYALKANRSDCKVGLLEQADLQERYYLRNNTYALDTATLYGATPPLSPEGICAMTVTSGDTNGFVATATALGGQLGDTGCTVLTLNQAGVKGPATAATCW